MHKLKTVAIILTEITSTPPLVGHIFNMDPLPWYTPLWGDKCKCDRGVHRCFSRWEVGGESYQYATVFLEYGGKYPPLPSALGNLENKCNIGIHYSFDQNSVKNIHLTIIFSLLVITKIFYQYCIFFP